MNVTLKLEVPGGLNLKRAWDYVGGRKAFEILAERYPRELRPFIHEGKGRLVVYRREMLDRLMERAEMEAREG